MFFEEGSFSSLQYFQETRCIGIFELNALLIPLKYNKKFMCITYLCAFNCIRGNSRKHGQALTKLSFLFQKMTENIKQIEA